MKNIIYISIAACFLLFFVTTGCTDESATVRTLQSAGYTEITTTGYTIFECSEDDTFHTGFRAKNPSGQWAKGTVCCGMTFKGCTIRY